MIPARRNEPIDPTDLAVIRASAHVRSLQRADGSWDYPCDFGASTTAQSLVALRCLGRLDGDLEAALLRSITRAQRDDGGFEGYPGAQRSDVGATASAIAALAGSSMREHDAPRARAERWLQANGGIEALVGSFYRGDVALLFAVAAGVVPAERLPFVPLSIWHLPRLARGAERFAHAGLSLLIGQLALLRKRHGGAWGSRGPASVADRRAVRNLLELFDEIQNPSGSFVANTQFTSLAALALSAAGLPPTDQRIERAVSFVLASIERDAVGATIPGNHSGVWSTALSLRALLRAGDPLEGTLLRSLAWLLDVQATEPNALCNHRDPGAARTGGFAFQPENHKMTDSDDTAIVIDTLASCLDRPELPAPLRSEVEAAIDRALAFLEAMQNPDGGWSAFVHGLPGKPAGPIMRTPPPTPTSPGGLVRLLRTPLYAFGDPSTEDVTGRVLRALGNTRYRRRPFVVSRGRAFLEQQQCRDGAWWGRWSSNFLWGTSHALVGLVATGTPLDAAPIRRGVEYLRARQNRDGSFGETERSYADPSLGGRGPSMPPLTATVLEALVRIGLARTDVARRAAKNLVVTQLADGSWPDGGHLQVMIPPLSFYVYPGAGRHPPLEALALYRHAVHGPRPSERCRPA